MNKHFMIFIWLVLTSCVPKIDSLWFDQDLLKFSQFNSTFISGFRTKSATTTHIGLTADSHQNYDDLNEVLARLNRRTDLDGVINLGDFTNQALALEYRYFLDLFDKLRVPKYSIIGNHDAFGLGEKIFEEVMGPVNQDLELDPVHMIFLNNNTLDTGPLDWAWLESVLAKPVTGMKMVFMHVNYNNLDYFPVADQTRFLNLMKTYNVGLVLNGHQHVYEFKTVDTVPMLQVHRTEGINYASVSVERTNVGEYDVEINRCSSDGCALAESYHFVE